MTLTQLLRNKPITDELMANPLTLLAAPEPSPSAPASSRSSPSQRKFDLKALDSTNSNHFCFSERGQAVGSRFYEFFAMPSALILSVSTSTSPSRHSVSDTSTTHALSRT